MEHERGAFKVKLPNRPTQLRNGWKFMGSIPESPLACPGSPLTCFGSGKIVPEF
jgi:hypothetical protein